MWKQDLLQGPDEQSALVDDLISVPNLDAPPGITAIGRTLVVKGEIRAAEHLIIEGRVEGQITVPDHGVAIGRHGFVGAEVLARTITVRGKTTGNLTAVDTVEILPTGHVEGRIVARRIAINEGAYFKGIVDPKLAEAAIAVGRHRFKQRADSPAS